MLLERCLSDGVRQKFFAKIIQTWRIKKDLLYFFCFYNALCYLCIMVHYLDLAKRNAPYQQELEAVVDEVMASGWFLRGRQLERFETEFARYIGTEHCIGVGNGLDALTLIYRAYVKMGVMAEGDEVIVPANTYIASILAISENQLVPVLVEPDPLTLQIDERKIEECITERTRSVMIVHLYGRCAFTPKIADICKEHGLLLVEDNAQAHGCRFGDRRTGALGHAAGHSFYPTKNLGAMGDAGAVTTNDKRLADMVRALGNYGSSRKYIFDYKGRNSRMDELQAAVLSVKLKHLDDENKRRQDIAEWYGKALRNTSITLPAPAPREAHVWHIYPVLCQERDRLRDHLARMGVEAQVHYPVPPHLQKCGTEWKSRPLPVTERIHATELSLPLGPELTDEELELVAKAVNSFQ